MSIILGRRSMHPRCCACGHGENCHPLRLGGACRRPECLCMEFEPVKGQSVYGALHERAARAKRPTWEGQWR